MRTEIDVLIFEAEDDVDEASLVQQVFAADAPAAVTMNLLRPGPFSRE